eukprot:c6593_g1_i1 orf=245-436(-)
MGFKFFLNILDLQMCGACCILYVAIGVFDIEDLVYVSMETLNLIYSRDMFVLSLDNIGFALLR